MEKLAFKSTFRRHFFTLQTNLLLCNFFTAYIICFCNILTLTFLIIIFITKIMFCAFPTILFYLLASLAFTIFYIYSIGC